MAIRLISSTSAGARLGAAVEFLSDRGPAEEALIVGASRGAADDVARQLARRVGATFGLARFSLTELAARAAVSRLAARVPGGDPEAVAARAVFDAQAAGELDYFAPVAAMPGFSRALARTLQDLRLAGVDAARLLDDVPAAADIGRLLARVEDQLAREPWWRNLRAYQNRRILVVDGDRSFNTPGPQLADAFEFLVGADVAQNLVVRVHALGERFGNRRPGRNLGGDHVLAVGRE